MNARAKASRHPIRSVPPDGPVIYDSTLRDGAQALGVTFSQPGKIRFAHLLDDFGVPYLEGGFAGSNERDMQFFRDAAKERFSQIRLVAFGATRRVGGSCKDDPLVQALLKAGTPAAAIYGKCWKLHVRDVLRTSEAENLDMVSETVEYLRARGLEVVFDAEHFFDGYKDDPAYALEVLRRARDAGASALALCDTHGGTLPEEVAAIVAAVAAAIAGADGRTVTRSLHSAFSIQHSAFSIQHYALALRRNFGPAAWSCVAGLKTSRRPRIWAAKSGEFERRAALRQTSPG